MKELGILQRLVAPTPLIFKKVQMGIYILSALDGVLVTYFTTTYPNSQLTIALTTFGATLLTIGTFLSKLPVDFDKYKEVLRAQLEVLEPTIKVVEPILPTQAKEVINEVKEVLNVQETNNTNVQ